jgi:hypothetical protein
MANKINALFASAASNKCEASNAHACNSGEGEVFFNHLN